MTFDPYLVWQLNNWDDHEDLIAYADVFMQRFWSWEKDCFGKASDRGFP